MLPITLELPEHFLEREIRSGCPVEAGRKEVWAVELDLLAALLRFCEENELKVYAAFGTLLGAVRHRGFIPWDDDIDLMMPRADYERLCRLASFDAPLFFQTETTDIGFTRAFARLRNSETTAIQNYERDFNIPYNQGIFIDIFPMDYMSDDREERKRESEAFLKLREKALRYSLFTFRCNNKTGSVFSSLWIKKCVSTFACPLLRALGVNNPYTARIERSLSQKQKSRTLGVYWFYEARKDNAMDEADFAETLLQPFEMLEIPIPSGYANILRREYGDWETPVMADTSHGELLMDAKKPYTAYLKEE